MAKSTDELCPRCFIGRLEAGKASFLTLHNEKLVTIPNVTAYTCDICDYREFDDPLVTWMTDLMGTGMNTDLNALTPTLQNKLPSRK